MVTPNAVHMIIGSAWLDGLQGWGNMAENEDSLPVIGGIETGGTERHCMYRINVKSGMNKRGL
jgi:hypothetical protein